MSHAAVRFFCTVLLVTVAAAGSVQGQEDPLVLRISDAIARPGGAATIVLRTYSPRPVGQGQLCLRSAGPGRGLASPFLAIEEVQVFSVEGDAQWSASLSPDGTQIDLSMSSATSSINEVDGPVLLIRLSLAPEVVAGQSWNVSLDPATEVRDAVGELIPIELRGGTLDIVDSLAPMVVEVEEDDAWPGGPAFSGAVTLEPRPLSFARFAFRMDPGVFETEPTFSVDPRYGDADLVVTHPQADLWQVDVTSMPATYNETLPGLILSIQGTLGSGHLPGIYLPVTLDPALTLFEDGHGASIDLDLVSGGFNVVSGEIFSDGFESGNLDAWLP